MLIGPVSRGGSIAFFLLRSENGPILLQEMPPLRPLVLFYPHTFFCFYYAQSLTSSSLAVQDPLATA